jgi:hypothetical protein
MYLCVAHLASFKSNILIISTNFPYDKCTLLETPYREVDVNISIPIPLGFIPNE